MRMPMYPERTDKMGGAKNMQNEWDVMRWRVQIVVLMVTDTVCCAVIGTKPIFHGMALVLVDTRCRCTCWWRCSAVSEIRTVYSVQRQQCQSII